MAIQGASKKRKAAAPPPARFNASKKPRKVASKSEPKRAAAGAPPRATSQSKKAEPTAQAVSNKDDAENGDDVITFDEQDDAAAVEPVSEDDQTAALLKGFESSSEEENENDADADAGPITDVPAIPSDPALITSLAAAAKTHTSTVETPGVLYIGRVPHGFYEHQMRAYFAQFGTISRLRLSRNRRTGASKHYAFIEFQSGEVARIVANTMDNYLMFGHILKVKVVPPERVHAELFKGAGKRFKKVPWNRIERGRLNATDRDGWKRRIEGEEKRRQQKKDKLKALGYEYDAPELRKVDDVAVQAIAPAPGAQETAEKVNDAHVAAVEARTDEHDPAEDVSSKPEPVSAEPMAIETAPQADLTKDYTAEEAAIAPPLAATEVMDGQTTPAAASKPKPAKKQGRRSR